MSDAAVELPVSVYSPVSQLRTPRALFRAMWHDLVASHELARRLFVRDVKAQYRQSLLGILWAFVPPIVTGMVFIVLRSQGVMDLGETATPYPVFVMVGTVLWQLFTQSLGAPLKAVITAKPMLAKIRFPYEALILAAVYGVLLNLAVNLVILAGVFIIFQVHVSAAILAAPLAMLVLMLAGISIGIALTPAGMLYTDIQTALPVVTQLWFFVTPVVYPPPTMYPLSLTVILNPVSPLLIAARDLLTRGELLNPFAFGLVGGLSVILLFLAWVAYRVSLPIIIERISA